MASHTITVFIASLLVAIATAQCPDLDPFSPAEAYDKADNILLGSDVSSLAGCQADGTCSRRQIQFQVQCVLKQTQDLSNLDLSKPINIGEDRKVRSCDRTFFGYGATQTMIVMVTVKKDSSNMDYLDWHETNNATRAHYVYGDGIQMSLGLTCDLKNPYNPNEDSCAVGREDCCSIRCKNNVPIPTGGDAPSTDKVRIWFSAEADSFIGVHCCKKMKAGAINKWITGANNDNNRVKAHALSSMPVVEISRNNAATLEENEQMAVAMYVKIMNGSETHHQVTWLVANIDGILLADGFMQLTANRGLTLINYTEILPSKDLDFMFEVYKHPNDAFLQPIDVPGYKDVCIQSEDNFMPACLFKLEDFLTDFKVEKMATAQAVAKPDDWSVWKAIRQYDATPLQACPLINSKVVPYGNTVLCPATATEESLGVTTVYSTGLLIFALAAILFLVK